MSKNLVSKEQAVSAAVKELLSRQDLSEYCKELSLMHSAFIQSHFADCQRTRVTVNGTYENLRDFLLQLSIPKNSSIEA